MPSLTNNNRFPKLRLLDIRPVLQGGRIAYWLRDPLQLAEKSLIVPQPLAPVLVLCDGTRDRATLRASLAIRYGLLLPADIVNGLVDALDEALLMENDRSAQAVRQVTAEYRAAPFRPPSLAGLSYPADPDELRRLLDEYLDEMGDVQPDPTASRGLVSPHIDYERGGPIYAQVWKRAAQMVKAADLAVILGTDHYGGNDRLTLTRQHYATPFGVLPTAQDLVDELAEVIGPEKAYAGEIRHRTEHSVELAAVWLHHIRGGQPIELLPILCGSFGHFVQNGAGPEMDPVIQAALEVIKRRTTGRRMIVVAAGDLAHIGPAFGGEPVDDAGRAELRISDDELIDLMCAGQADGFFQAIKRTGDCTNVCGVSPIYLTLRLLDPVQGQRAGYDHCPADPQQTSFVSVCGVVFQ